MSARRNDIMTPGTIRMHQNAVEELGEVPMPEDIDAGWKTDSIDSTVDDKEVPGIEETENE